MYSLYNRGYTLVELMLVIGILSIVLSIGSLSFASIQMQSRLDLSASEIKAELARAQSNSENGIASGVYFEPDRFVYFEGDEYQEGIGENIETSIPSNLSLTTIALGDSIAQFEKVNGYLASWEDPSEIVVTDTGSGQTRTISINRWGVIEID